MVNFQQSKPQANFRSLKILKNFRTPFLQRNTRQTISVWFGLAPLSAVWRGDNCSFKLLHFSLKTFRDFLALPCFAGVTLSPTVICIFTETLRDKHSCLDRLESVCF
jgi:hypothetical protein